MRLPRRVQSGDARGLLSAVLEGVEPHVGDGRRIRVAVHAEDTAHREAILFRV
jgi:hypothetical protein